MRKLLFVAFAILTSVSTFAQTTVTGTVTDAATGDVLPGANIKIERKLVGTNSDFDGKFTLQVTDVPPFNIEVSMLGFKTEKVAITANNQVVTVKLTENATALDEVVVSASRTPERIMESPVTVERMDVRAIRNTSSPSFYDGLENLKGVDINTNSLTFKSVNTRGFATFANTRFMQLVDGMDNSSPALNFALGNLLGMSELDVKTVELLPGASSALYGANAFNGIMFMTSKSPFDDQGISYVLKSGITSQKAAGDNKFYDTSIRMAYAFSNHFAAKATLSYLEGTEWYATDYRNTLNGDYIPGDRNSDKNFDGLNVYGDEVSTSLGGAIGKVSRTGYNELDLMDYEAKSTKLGVSLHYRPLGNDRVEIIWNSKYGIGNTIYQGQNRYNIKDFFMEQHKLEVKGKSFFVRGYLTSEDAGNSYDTRFTAININREWKSDTQWFTEYAGAYFMTGSHATARQVADTGRFMPGTPQFKQAFDKVTADPNLTTGSKFQDLSKIYHVDANLNLRDYIEWAEVQVGGSFRKYSLNSNGSIFTDYDGAINYNEFGVYSQLQKKFMEDRLKFTASMRFDKAQNFKGNVSPRISFAYAAGDDKNHNFRASFQTGFRNPTTQDQYIGLDAGAGILVGSAPDNLDRYISSPLTVSAAGQAYTNGATSIKLSGRRAYDNSFSAASIANGTYKKANIELVKPERVTAYEIGYRGLADVTENKISIDLSMYYNNYEDFISSKNVAVPFYGNAGDNTLSLLALQNGDYKGFSVYTNSTADISSYGASIGLNTKILEGFDVGLSYTFAKFDFDQTTDPDFEAGFNTPKHKVKFQFGNSNLFENFGFNLNVRWQDEYYWESSIHDTTIDARTVVDAQVNYRLPSLKSVIKLGGANLLGKEYFSAPGVGAIGSQYFLSWTINN